MQNQAEKEERYLREFIPKLLKYQPRQWVPIDQLANDVGDFIETVLKLCAEGHFTDAEGYCIIDIKEDAFVRLDPEYLRRQKPGFRIWK